MFKKPIVWAILTLISIGSVIFTFKYFSRAFPIVTLDLKMDRRAALQAASELAKKYNWGPQNFKQAASFGVDGNVQNFVELEAGGADAFRKMLKEGLYSPYTWRVRHFGEGQTNETLISFNPAGQPYCFSEKLPEDEPGATLDPNEALVIAEKAAKGEWQIDLSAYKLVEKSQEIRPGGRKDHYFVYERPNVQISEGHYRLRLVVSGDKFTGLTHFIKVPEAFSRRYQEMRSANNTIGISSFVSVVILYYLGGCVIGLFILLRQHWVIWRKPLWWGIFVAFAQVLVAINYWPLSWMSYDTALSAQGFLLRQIMQLFLIFVDGVVVFTIIFMAAESLTRKAFPDHIQMWRLWSSDVAGSPAILGRTISSYLLVGVFFAFNIVFYLFTTKVLGWWIPSDTLFQPDVLSTYFPWLTSVAISLQAGFMEECLFRAIPIAGAALLGQRFGMRRLWIVGALIIQALIFGAGHTPYPNEPAYARLVELIIPSLGWGLIYLYFGLLPGIILHFTFDATALSVPLFVASAPGIWVDRIIIIVLVLIPLWVVLLARLRNGRWNELKNEDFNRSWQPPVKEEPSQTMTEVQRIPEISSRIKRWILAGGILGVILWFAFTNFKNDAPSLSIERNDAEKLARETLIARGIELPNSWEILSVVSGQVGQDDRFVWQNGGKKNYHVLMGVYLGPPHWEIRFVHFKGDVAERAEEYQVCISKKGEVLRFIHKLPEARAGASITEEEARKIAYSVLREKYRLEPSKLKEISAVPYKLPARKDWLLTFEDTENYPLEKGQARIAVKIAGDEAVDCLRYVHVPEEWMRQDRSKGNLLDIMRSFEMLIVYMLFFAGIIAAIIRWTRKNFPVRLFLQFFVLLLGLNVTNCINIWSATIAGFSTTEPLRSQIFSTIAFSILESLFLSVGISLVAGFVCGWNPQQPQSSKTGSLFLGFSLGTLFVGLRAVVSGLLEPSMEPSWAQYGTLSNYIPILGIATDTVLSCISLTVFFLLVFTAVDHFTKSWTQRRIVISILLILLVLIIEASSVSSLSFGLFLGLLAGFISLLIYKFILRCEMALIPLMIGSIAVFNQLKEGILNAYPAAIPSTVLSIILIGAISIYWYKVLSRCLPHSI